MVKTSDGYMPNFLRTKQDKANRKMLPELEAKTKAKQRENVIAKLADTGEITGADTGKLKYIPKAERPVKEEKGSYISCRPETGCIEMPGKAPKKNK